MVVSDMYFFVIVMLMCATARGNNSNAFVFPQSVNDYSFNTQRLPSQPLATHDPLARVRGTVSYNQFVEDVISRGIGRLTVNINKLLKQQKKSAENVLFSPISITGALALVLLGSNGKTFKQISEFWGLQIGIGDIDKKSQIVHEQFARMLAKLNRTSGFELGDEIDVASALFVQTGYPIRPIYKSLAEDLYQSSVINLDFQTNGPEARRTINDWVAAKTNNKITNILPDDPPNYTKVIITSALYFNAEWEHHFFPDFTKRRPFYVNGAKSPTDIEVDMMANGGEFPYYKDPTLGCEILGLPYKGNRSTMYIVKPLDSDRDKLQELETKLTANNLNRLVGNVRPTEVVMLFPRMKLESTLELKETLKLLGVTSLFNPAEANLAVLSSGVPEPKKPPTNGVPLGSPVPDTLLSIDNIRQLINEQSTDNNFQNPGLYADEVWHKVAMDITEKGTEAAAATSVSLSKSGKTIFRADVPFCFFIRHDETNIILFWGSVVTPNPHYKKT